MNAQIIDLAQLLRDRDIAHYGGASMESAFCRAPREA